MSIKDTKIIKGQPHLLAYITPNEVEKLKTLGGQETMTPEGIPAYPEYDNYGFSSQADFDSGDVSKSNDPNVRGTAPGQNRVTASQLAAINAREKQDAIKKDIAKRELEKSKYDVGPKNIFEKLGSVYKYGQKVPSKFRTLSLKNLIDQKMKNKTGYPGFLSMANVFNPSMVDKDYTYDSAPTTDMLGVNIQDYMDTEYGLTGKNMTDIDRVNRALDQGRKTGNISQKEFEAAFFGDKGPPDFTGGKDDGQQPYLPINYNTGAATTEAVEPYTNDFTYRFGDDQNVIYDQYGSDGYRTTAAEGGIMGTRARRAMGGIMNRVDKRQGYGFGSIVKSITKPFKSVAKAAGKVLSSDVGKMALLAAGTYYMSGGMKFGGAKMFGNTANSTFMGNLGRVGTYIKNNPFKTIGLTSAALPFLMPPAKPNEDIGMGERGGQLIDPLTGEPNNMAGMRENIELAKLEAGDDPDKLDAIDAKYNNMLNLKYHAGLPDATPFNLYGSRGYRTTRAATGGRIGYGLGKSVGVFQPTSASMSTANAPSFEGGTGMGGMIADLIRKNPNMFKRSKNSTPINQNNDGMYSKMFNNSQLFNQLSNNNDFIDENMNGIDDREETIMANGGRIGRAEGGLMDLGGMEKDYRAEGGFVPIGEYEKKDDVPARLSVNEFVFTADAVRGAGQGDIDKGAEIMENMMENLENGGTVSEESQGNKGAQNMFKTSERLGAVI